MRQGVRFARLVHSLHGEVLLNLHGNIMEVTVQFILALKTELYGENK